MSRSAGRRPARGAPPAGGAGRVRIIAGIWRGRRIEVPVGDGLRPTPDRVRETLFNWLQPRIDGARVLDLFAGSGALALEAASRGAAAVTCIERDPRVADALRRAVGELPGAVLEVRTADALAYLDGVPETFDLVFVDPPYAAGLHDTVLARLLGGGWLGPAARIYVESARPLVADELPPGLELLKAKRAGEVCYHLLRVE